MATMEMPTRQDAALPYSVGPLPSDAPFGATVEGLRLTDLARDDVKQALNKLWIERGVLVFRGGDSSQEFHVRLSEVFGPHQPHAFAESVIDGFPQLIKVRYFPDDGSIYEIDGKPLGGWIPWHQDNKFGVNINRGGILRPVQLPAKGGGKTGYLDLAIAYERMPDALKARIEKLHVVYEMNIDHSYPWMGIRQTIKPIRFPSNVHRVMGRRFEFPRVLHPMVYRQRETGRPILNVSPFFAMGIYEDGGEAGDTLLREVLSYCTDDAIAYYHDWQYDDLVLWDNWRVLHSSTGIEPDDSRLMQRTTLAGDYALGRVLPEGQKRPNVDV